MSWVRRGWGFFFVFVVVVVVVFFFQMRTVFISNIQHSHQCYDINLILTKSGPSEFWKKTLFIVLLKKMDFWLSSPNLAPIPCSSPAPPHKKMLVPQALQKINSLASPHLVRLHSLVFPPLCNGDCGADRNGECWSNLGLYFILHWTSLPKMNLRTHTKKSRIKPICP